MTYIPPSKKDRIYRIWCTMKSRCSNINHPDYQYYGGRGITVCEEWRLNFMSFKEWSLENGYYDSLTIDRVNNNGNYEPLNCRWATMKEQSINKRKYKKRSVFINK